ncbi:FAD-binding oxidoreductase [Pseudooceanicola sp. CBS1P-1]|uniref:FAD-dependent oxidoreductase n=1 Tax=Pseudooceanicola albus TaxID=2692189 RepID=A0A6L7G1Q7_9RHOB|nr:MULTISPECIES: FAD-binding oxidoreductase [Pseudooceanicola]MBT9383593.1 FAD-binding oxidoreductase [Pseudooceanicola endophyticus]MXN17448.1 FAD-dependent oxidoreductase [Pseudooceanicola albus]
MTESYPQSYYAGSRHETAPFAPLDGDTQADVAIIGGGFTGVATALELAERGVSVVLVEANRIGWGATGRNGGQITGSLSGDAAMLREFSKVLGPEAAERFVWDLRWRGHDIIRARVARYGIDCDLKDGHLHAAWKASHLPELEAMHRLACTRGMEDQVTLLRGEEVQQAVGCDLYVGGLLNRRNMHVHSLNLCLGEAEAARSLGARLHEGTRALDIEEGDSPVVITDRGRIRAGRVLLAGNAYHRLAGRRLAGLLFPATLGVVATDPLPEALARQVIPMDIGVYDTRFVLDYYRLTADRRLLFGGGTNYTGRDLGDVAGQLRPAIERTFPALRGIGIPLAWQGTAGITLNRIPQLGTLSNRIFYAQGYSGHGIATTHIVGEIMAQALTGRSRDFEVFSKAHQWRLPVGRRMGNLMLALGMWYFQKREAWR